MEGIWAANAASRDRLAMQCVGECSENGETVGSFRASLFCGVSVVVRYRPPVNICSLAAQFACQTAFYSTVSAECPGKLGTPGYQEALSNACVYVTTPDPVLPLR